VALVPDDPIIQKVRHGSGKQKLLTIPCESGFEVGCLVVVISVDEFSRLKDKAGEKISRRYSS
jgi:hypothetical protein